MTRDDMIQKLARAYNKAHGTRYRCSGADNYAAINEAIEVGTEEAFWNREIVNFVKNYAGDDMKAAFKAYVNSKRNPETPAPVVE
ncbi:MAG: hypothetical protein MJY71_08265, partial [Bacteroidaceae bacterium]|nr:hypothetical protein [Bacteroidaceae bacterium]